MKIAQIKLPIIILYTLSLTFYTCSKSDDEPAQNSMEIIAMDPSSPASLQFNEFVVITYEYTIVPEEGARMWIIPYTDGDTSPAYLYSSSSVFTGSGTRQVGVSIEEGDGPVVVDQLKVTMVDPDQNQTYIERFVDVNYTFSE